MRPGPEGVPDEERKYTCTNCRPHRSVRARVIESIVSTAAARKGVILDSMAPEYRGSALARYLAELHVDGEDDLPFYSWKM